MYKSQATSTQVTQEYGTLLGLEEPTREGYTFDGWTIDGGGSMIRGIPFGDNILSSWGVTRTTEVDALGDKYSKYVINIYNETSNFVWPFVDWPKYKYISGHEYKISAYIRANKISGFWMMPEFRHSAIVNDFNTVGRKRKLMTTSNKFVEYTETRIFKGNKILQENVEYDIAPLIEMYFHIESGSTGIADIDVKNISIYDVTAGKYVTDGAYGGYIYKYGSKNATLTANWVKNN